MPKIKWANIHFVCDGPVLERGFSALADAGLAPVVVHDIPYHTGAVLPRDLLLTLAQHPNTGASCCR